MNDTTSKTDSNESEEPIIEGTETSSAAAAASSDATETTPTENASVEVEPTLEELLEKARQDATSAKEAHLRAVADLENFRRRTARERDDLRAYAAANVVEELMPVLDNLGFALLAAKAPNAELKSLTDGVEMVANQFKTALGNHGLKEVNPVGGDFDPNLHEAMSQQPSDEVEEGKVLQVIRVGYTLNGRLLRPASVIVSGGPASDDAKSES
ncbi:nucleotide exchange factor GrpE [Actomonas aquatica]|uniref:Protein GrpE n=1 Tax=Actomonas aquatica TaxID=2866162 RepID=A0ABZ1CF38_9BACT|nr:nucleotide exchange factor GrpE [Opitutus sp. WL0086]WRQ89843.1 nucleotide exchange factor GrpE [Opitutus sp. WL0086]